LTLGGGAFIGSLPAMRAARCSSPFVALALLRDPRVSTMFACYVRSVVVTLPRDRLRAANFERCRCIRKEMT
jgi:hypothetical protein